MIVKLDDKGRIYLPKEIREKNKSKDFYITEVPDGILLVPKIEDPVKILEVEGEKLSDLSIADLKKSIRKETEKEVDLH